MIDIRTRAGGDVEGRLIRVPVTLRAKDGDEGPVLEGYAALFDEWARIGGDAWGFMESIAPGAFARSLKEDEDIKAFFNHDGNQVLGSTFAKTAIFEEDKKGLRALIYPPDTAAGRDVVTLVKRGDVRGMSFMFSVRPNGDEWTEPEQKGELPKRVIRDVQLFEAGPVTLPAYEATSISARDRAKAFLSARAEMDRLLDPDVLARRREADRLAFELAAAAVEI